jgi:hypothetical protein
MTQVDRAAAYTAAAAIYADLRQQLHLESLAALSLLAEAGAPEAVILLEGLAGRDAVRAVLGLMTSDTSRGEDKEAGEDEETGAEDVRNRIARALQAALVDAESVPEGPGRKVLMDAAAASRKVSRAGFRREDRADADMIAALRSSAGAVFEVIRELDRLMAVLSQKAPGRDISADVASTIPSSAFTSSSRLVRRKGAAPRQSGQRRGSDERANLTPATHPSEVVIRKRVEELNIAVNVALSEHKPIYSQRLTDRRVS